MRTDVQCGNNPDDVAVNAGSNNIRVAGGKKIIGSADRSPEYAGDNNKLVGKSSGADDGQTLGNIRAIDNSVIHILAVE